MAVTLNLLPTDFQTSGKILVAASNIKKILVVSLVILIVAGVAAGGYLLTLNNQKGQLEESNSQLVSRVQSLKQVEENLVILKDRATKIAAIRAQTPIDKSYNSLSFVDPLIPEGIGIINIDIGEDRLSVSFTSDNSQAVTQLLANVESSSNFRVVSMDTLAFTGEGEYSLDLEFVPN